LFVLAAIGGLTMLVVRLRGSNPPTWLAIGHGILALSGVAILGHQYEYSVMPQHANWALLVFLGAAMGGAFLFFTYQIRGRLLPVPIILAHGLIAATGLGLLLTSLYG
jgi:hypothetical protein